MKETGIKQMFAKYVSLNILGMIGLSCYILADTFFIARGVGAGGLAALNLAIPIYSFVNGLGLMLGMGGATRFTISKTENSFTQALCFAGLIGIVFALGGTFFSSILAEMLGADGVTLGNTAVYLKVILCFAPMFLLNNVVICFVRNDSNPRLSMIAMLMGSLSNIVLDYVFIFPLGMGMFGAALATGIAPIISLAILSRHFKTGKHTLRLVAARVKIKAFFDMAALGVSALINEVSAGIVIIAFNILILNIAGNMGVAAYGIIANIALVVMAVFTGIAQGMQPIISMCYRERQQHSIKKVLKYGVITAVFVAVLVYGVALIFAEPIVGVFNRDGNPELAKIAVQGLTIYFIAFAFAGVNIVCATYFSGIDSPKNAFIISLLRGLVLIVPAAIVLSAIFGINGIWLAVPVCELMVLGVSCYMMLKNNRVAINK